MVEEATKFIRIDLNQFKLHLHLKPEVELTLHFDSPSRRFYLSLIGLVVHEMKKLGRVTSIPLQKHLDVLALLNKTVGMAAGSSKSEHLLPRIYRKWKDALPDLENAPLFKVVGRKKKYDELMEMVYVFSEAENDSWANLFEYKGSNENVRLRFSIDRLNSSLDDVIIVYGESPGVANGDAWESFVSDLKEKTEEKSNHEGANGEFAESELPLHPLRVQIAVIFGRWMWPALCALIGLVVVVAALAGLKNNIFFHQVKTDSVEKVTLPLPDKPSIAVLPFDNLSGDPKQEYFSDGITDDLITDLSKISGLMVIARNSTFTYKGKPVKVKQVAEELGVRYVLEGSVRRDDNIIRINAQLIDAIDGHDLWAERYDGKMDRVFALQDQITQKIVSALKVKLTGGEKEQVGQRGTDNIEAYNAVLEGWGLFYRYTPDCTARAAALFKKAIELDPNYGDAYVGLAQVYYQVTLFTPLLPALNMSWYEARLRLRENTQMAMKKPSPGAYNLSGLLYLSRRQHKEALAEEERGLALEPNNPVCLFNKGRVLYLGGKPKEGIEYLNKRWRLDPRSRYLYLIALGIANFCMGEIEEAVSIFEQIEKLNPGSGTGSLLPACYALLGRDQDARARVEMDRKKLGGRLIDIGAIMFSLPLSDRAIGDRYAEGLLKAGYPPGKISGGYFPAFKENQLTGEEIEDLLMGSRITGIKDGQQWWVDREKNGEFTWRGPALKDPVTQKIIPAPTQTAPYSDRGKSWIEGDTICHQFEKLYWGLEFCGTVFRNPKGTNESKDEYFFCNDIGFTPFSLVR
jgi:adenylate cyclase